MSSDVIVKVQVMLTEQPQTRRLAVTGFADLRSQLDALYPGVGATAVLEYTDADGDAVMLQIDAEWRAMLSELRVGEVVRLRLLPGVGGSSGSGPSQSLTVAAPVLEVGVPPLADALAAFLDYAPAAKPPAPIAPLAALRGLREEADEETAAAAMPSQGSARPALLQETLVRQPISAPPKAVAAPPSSNAVVAAPVEAAAELEEQAEEVRPPPPSFAAATAGARPTPPPYPITVVAATAHPKAGFAFDSRWYNASLAGCDMQVKFTDERAVAEVVRDTSSKRVGFITLRAAQPLRANGARQFRMRMEKWGWDESYVHIGLVPRAAEAKPWLAVYELDGCCMSVSPQRPMHPHGAWTRPHESGPIEFRLPAGGDIQISVDFAAGTAAVELFLPSALAGPPAQRVEFRFTRRFESAGMELYPAVSLWKKGDAVRFV